MGIVCHKSARDEGALACMCGRDEELWLSMTSSVTNQLVMEVHELVCVEEMKNSD
jgi:hypothetical protein